MKTKILYTDPNTKAYIEMAEIWECISGKAKSKLYPETTGEKSDEQQADHF